jgi:4-hydroxy-3-methylbut-2-enyl diphosphate reductase
LEIIIAEHSGFCFGVNRAIDMAFSEADKTDRQGRIYTCGHLIHNAAVVKRLKEKGVGMISSLAEAETGDTVIVRSHGEPREFYEEAEARGINLVDTTCVFVKKIHELVSKAHDEGIPVVVIGDSEHQEVKATNGWCGYDACIIGDADKAKAVAEDLRGSEPMIVCQTTIKQELQKEILDVFDSEGIEYDIHNTICNATRERQDSCAELASQVDAMIVIGDRHSSNSRKLYEIAKKKTMKTPYLLKMLTIIC